MLESFSALRSKNYRLYFYGQTVSMVGTWMQAMVQSWLVYRLSNSASWLGIIAFCTQLPAFLVAPAAGIMADQRDRRVLLIWVEVAAMLQALVLAALVFSGKVQLWHVAVLAVVLGLSSAFESITRHSLAVDLVGRADLGSAISLNSVTINASRVVGPALAGLCIGIIGEGGCFLLNGLSYLAVIYGLAVMTLNPRQIVRPANANSLHHLKEAVSYVRRSPKILKLLFMATFVSFVGFPYSVLLPVFSKDVFHGDAKTLAWLTAATGVGAVLGAFSISVRSAYETVWNRLLLYAAGMGAGFIMLAFVSQLWLGLVAMFAIGYFMMGCFPAINSTIQLIVEDHVRGRVVSLYTMTFLGSTPVGCLLAGWLAERMGVRAVSMMAGIASMVLGIALLIRNTEPQPSEPSPQT